MWLKLLHSLGLTDLRDEEVAAYYRKRSLQNAGDSADEVPQIDALIRQLRAANTPITDVLRDIRLLISSRLNLMDPAQLATAQIEQNGPFQISVFAPDPLENHNLDVYQSTLSWVKQHINEVSEPYSATTQSGELTQSPRMQFWARLSEKTPAMLQIVRRIHKDMVGDDRVFRLFECVRAPDHLFYIDMTVHRFRNRSQRVYINQREKGVTSVLLQLPSHHADSVIEMLAEWLRNASKSDLAIDEAGSGLYRKTEELEVPHLITCWTITNEGLGTNGGQAPLKVGSARSTPNG